MGGKNQLQKGVTELDKDRDTTLLAEKPFDFIMNVPDASHMGSVWEHQIRTVRSVMSSVLTSAAGRLNNASLKTFLYEAMAIKAVHSQWTQSMTQEALNP